MWRLNCPRRLLKIQFKVFNLKVLVAASAQVVQTASVHIFTQALNDAVKKRGHRLRLYPIKLLEPCRFLAVYCIHLMIKKKFVLLAFI